MALLTAVIVLLAIVGTYVLTARPSVRGQNLREFSLVAKAATITVASGVAWNAWTYNGTVPGPTLRVRVGDLVQIHFTNELNFVHSVHVHGLRYSIESDGSQAYPASMPGPGQSYTYTYEATRPGLFYYHCHSSDGATSCPSGPEPPQSRGFA